MRTIYDDQTGEVIARIASSMSPPLATGQALFDGDVDPESRYVDPTTKEPADKQSFAEHVTTTTGQATISNLPAATQVTCNGASTQVDDGTITISCDIPGAYSVELSNVPRYVDKALAVTIP